MILIPTDFNFFGSNKKSLILFGLNKKVSCGKADLPLFLQVLLLLFIYYFFNLDYTYLKIESYKLKNTVNI
jgi:hypothetical protein